MLSFSLKIIGKNSENNQKTNILRKHYEIGLVTFLIEPADLKMVDKTISMLGVHLIMGDTV